MNDIPYPVSEWYSIPNEWMIFHTHWANDIPYPANTHVGVTGTQSHYQVIKHYSNIGLVSSNSASFFSLWFCCVFVHLSGPVSSWILRIWIIDIGNSTRTWLVNKLFSIIWIIDIGDSTRTGLSMSYSVSSGSLPLVIQQGRISQWVIQYHLDHWHWWSIKDRIIKYNLKLNWF